MRAASWFLLVAMLIGVMDRTGAQTPGPVIQPEQELTPLSGEWLTAIEVFGKTAVVGSPLAELSAPARPGLVSVFRKTGTGDCQATPCWTLRHTLQRPLPFPGDRFGQSIELIGRTLVVSSPGDYSNPTADGAVFIYERVGNQFVLRQTLTPPNGETNFGVRLKLQGDRLAVSALLDQYSNMNPVYVFARNAAGIWTQQARLVPPQNDEDQFGKVLEMQNNRLIVGSARYADVFVEVNGAWQADGRISPPGIGMVSSVEISGRRAFIGDPLSTSIHEYRRNDSGAWTPFDTFFQNGWYWAGGMQLQGRDRLFVAEGHAVHLYARSAGSWQPQASFSATDSLDPLYERSFDYQGGRLGAIFGNGRRAFIFNVPQ